MLFRSVDGVRGLSLSENGTVLLGAGYSQSALAALKRPARGAPFVAMTDMTLTAAFNQAYPRSLVDTSRPALLPDGSVVAFTRATDGQGGFSEKYVWMAGDGKDKSAQLPPRMRLFLGATTAGPQVAWQDSDGRVQLSRTALGAPYAAVPYASVGASGVLSLMDPCVGAFARVLDADSSSDFVFTRLAPSDEVAKFVMEGSSLQ